jgi:hypothetical protein
VRRILVSAFLFVAVALRAQNPPRSVEANPQVFLITVGEGAHYFEKFGHNALWFYEPSRGIDVAFNWGVFDFASPGFLRKQVVGNTLYWVEGVPGPYMIDAYRSYDRTITLQKLNLTPEQARKAYEYALWNARDENKYYRYDYFRDNCSTRVRDLIDLAVGGGFKAQTSSVRVPKTYRSESLRLVDDLKFTQFGIDVGLAEPADRQITLWENMFVPSVVQLAARNATIPGAGDTRVPLVTQERVLYRSRSHAERADNASLSLPYLIVGLLIGAELFFVGRIGERQVVVDKVFRVEVAVWALGTGLLGFVLLFLWTMTQHVYTYRNENLLLLNPLSLWLAIVALLSVWRARWTRPAAIVAAIIAMLSALGLMLKGFPGFPQDNLPVIFLLLPPHFAAAFGLSRRSARVNSAA